MRTKKNVYSEETKRMVIEMKLSKKYTNKQIMEKCGVRNVTQIKVWMKWFREGGGVTSFSAHWRTIFLW